jgi:hypothetical protein
MPVFSADVDMERGRGMGVAVVEVKAGTSRILAVVIWALVGYWPMGEMKPQGVRTTTHA